jgi:hypothetical protein
MASSSFVDTVVRDFLSAIPLAAVIASRSGAYPDSTARGMFTSVIVCFFSALEEGPSSPISAFILYSNATSFAGTAAGTTSFMQSGTT